MGERDTTTQPDPPTEARGLAGADLYRAEALGAFNTPEAPRPEPTVGPLLRGLWLVTLLLVAWLILALIAGGGQLWA